MINKYPQAISNNFKGYAKFLALILSTFISNGIRQGKFVLGNSKQNFKIYSPSSFGADNVFYACCNNILKYPSDLESEEKIAYYLWLLFKAHKNIESLFEWLSIAGNSFILGHFMSFDEIKSLISNFDNLEK